jgi:dienelactone hydrolase
VRPLVLALLVAASGLAQAPTPEPPNADQKFAIETKMRELAAHVKALSAKKVDPALLADVDVYRKAAEYILRFPQEFATSAYVGDTLAVLDTGLNRAKDIEAGSPSWTKRKGHVVRAYVSAIDGSVQPYGLTIPESYDGSTPVRLDVWQHGTNRALNEVAFIVQQESNRPIPADQTYIQLEPLGRTNVSYRWAGEADLFEAIASVEQRYRIDPDRIVLRGFSMGGASSWHLGLHHPGRFAAIEAGAGYTETRRYGHRDNLPSYQEAMLHYYDAVDYALNAYNTPTVGYGGELDAQLQASVNIREQLVKEGFRFQPDGPYRWITSDLRALFLIGPQTEHAWHPDSKAESSAFIDKALEQAGHGRNHLRFVTYTTRFNRAHWLTVEALDETYTRAEVDAIRSEDGKTYTLTTKNVSRLSIEGTAGVYTIDTKRLEAGSNPSFVKSGGTWTRAATTAGSRATTPLEAGLQKVHGLQGPVDDAFMDAFLCVRPTGTAWNGVAREWAAKTLDTFAANFAKWLRGDVRVKADRDVSANDIAAYNLILFGDPGSNRLLAVIAGKLPIAWTKATIEIGTQRFSAADHIPVLIYPNPLNPRRYVVINSGHTFGDADFRGTNAWLYPRLADYSVLKATGDIVMSGFFDEQWRLPAAPLTGNRSQE